MPEPLFYNLSILSTAALIKNFNKGSRDQHAGNY